MADDPLSVLEQITENTDERLGRDGLRQLYRAWCAARGRRGACVTLWLPRREHEADASDTASR